MRVLGIIPARGGSKRVPGKNLRTIGGKPLVLWSVECAGRARSLSRIVLSSDDDAILALAKGSVVPLRRPAELSRDVSPAIDYVRHSLAWAAAEGDEPFDAVAIIQPSSPFTSADDIDATVALLSASKADSAVSVVELEHALNPLKLKTMVGDRLLPYLEEERGRMAAGELPSVFVRNGSVYASRVSTIKSGSILGDDSRGYVMSRGRSVDINDELDLEFADFLAARSRPDSTTEQ